MKVCPPKPGWTVIIRIICAGDQEGLLGGGVGDGEGGEGEGMRRGRRGGGGDVRQGFRARWSCRGVGRERRRSFRA